MRQTRSRKSLAPVFCPLPTLARLPGFYFWPPRLPVILATAFPLFLATLADMEI